MGKFFVKMSRDEKYFWRGRVGMENFLMRTGGDEKNFDGDGWELTFLMGKGGEELKLCGDEWGWS